jgi:hypothetical protein
MPEQLEEVRRLTGTCCQAAASPCRHGTWCPRARHGRSWRHARRSGRPPRRADRPSRSSATAESPARGRDRSGGRAGHRGAAGNHPRRDLELAQQRVLAGGERRSQASAKSLPPGGGRGPRRCWAPTRGTDGRGGRARDACRLDRCRARGSGPVVLGVVMGQVELGVGAVEDDDVEVEILLDQPDEPGELGHGGRRDRVDRRVVECHPAVTGAATIDAEVRPRPLPRVRTRAVVGRAGVGGAHGGLLRFGLGGPRDALPGPREGTVGSPVGRRARWSAPASSSPGPRSRRRLR